MPNPIRDFDGEIPRNYDRCLGPALFEHYADDLARRAAATAPKDVLELACGTGILTRRLLDKLPATARLVATDLSMDMVNYARGKIGADERIGWRQADGMAPPFANASFDVVVLQFGWMFMPDKTVAARQALRLLRPGGTFLFNTWNGLACNDLPRVVQTVLEERFPGAPPQFLPFAFAPQQRDIAATALRDAGFRQVDMTDVEKRGTAASARDVATGLLTGTPLRYALLERGNADPNGLIDAITDRLTKELGDPATGAQMSALVVTGSV